MLRPPTTTTASVADFRASGWREICNRVGAAGYFALSNALRTAAIDAVAADAHSRGKILWLLGDACAFRLVPGNLNEPLEQATNERGQLIGPLDFSDVDIDLLRQICGEIDNVWLRARVAEVLWLSRRPRDVQDAIAAIDAYRCIPVDVDHWFHGGKDCWRRAAVLALQIRGAGAALLRQIEAALLAAVDEPHKSGDAVPSMIEVLLDLGLAEERVADLGDLLVARANRISSGDGTNRFFLARHSLSLAKRCFAVTDDCEGSADVDCAISQSYCAEAELRIAGENPSYFVAASFYADAIQALLDVPRVLRARRDIDQRLQMLRQRQRNVAQQSGRDFAPLRSSPIDIGSSIRRAQDAVTGKSLTEALLELAEAFPLASRRHEEESTRRRMEEFLFSRLFATQKLAADGRVIAQSPAVRDIGDNSQQTKEAVWAKMVQNYVFRVRYAVQASIAPAFRQLHVEHVVTERDMVDVVGLSGTVPGDRITLMAKGLKAGFDGDFVVALHLLIPQLEHLVRVHLRNHGETTTVTSADGLQLECSLSSLVEQPGMERVFGEDLTFEIRALFCERFGPNLRNEVAHGLLDAGSMESAESIYAWWLIFRLIYLQYWYRDD